MLMILKILWRKSVSAISRFWIVMADLKDSFPDVVSLGAKQKKKVILVDHNERSQAVDGIEEAEIIEIIGHHRLGDIETVSPITFRNQPVGCTATIINQMYEENEIEVPREIAGLLCGNYFGYIIVSVHRPVRR